MLYYLKLKRLDEEMIDIKKKTKRHYIFIVDTLTKHYRPQ